MSELPSMGVQIRRCWHDRPRTASSIATKQAYHTLNAGSLRHGMSDYHARKQAATSQASASKNDSVHRSTRRLTVHRLTPLLAFVPSRNRESYGREVRKFLSLVVDEVVDGLERLSLVFVDGSC